MEQITADMRQTAAALVLSTLRKLGREDLLPYLWIDWRPNFTSRMGDALYATPQQSVRHSAECFRIDGMVVRVRFSATLWPRATEEQRKQTVIHEVCHLVTCHEAHLAGRRVPASHGLTWQLVMRRAGVSPSTSHNVNVAGLGRRTVRATCACGEHYVTPRIASRITSHAASYRCCRCRKQLVVAEGEQA